MARALTSAMITEITSPRCCPVLLFEGNFTTTVLRLWNGVGDISWNSQTWLGNGWLDFPSGLVETVTTEAHTMEIEIASIPQAVLSAVLNQGNVMMTGTLWLAGLDASNQIIADPYVLFSGKFDTAQIDEGAEGSVVKVSYETQLVNMVRSKEFRYTPESQKIFYPLDKGFDWVASLQDWNGYWGSTAKKVEKKKKTNNTVHRRAR